MWADDPDLDDQPLDDGPTIPPSGGGPVLDIWDPCLADDADARPDALRAVADVHSGQLQHAPELVPYPEVPKPGPGAETRGRKRGQTANAMSLQRLVNPGPKPVPAPVVAAMSRHDICRAAGKARQAKRGLTAEFPSNISGIAPSTTATAPDGAIVPFDAGQTSDESLFNNQHAQQSLVKWIGSAQAVIQKSLKVEAGIFQSGLRTVSKSYIAKQLKISRQTVDRHMRLLAVCLLLVRKMRTENRFKLMPAFFSTRCPGLHARKLLFTVKYKYDEMSLRARTVVSGQPETSIKIFLQGQVFLTALYKLGDRYVRVQSKMPSTVRMIESASTGCMRAGRDAHVISPALNDDVGRKTRPPVCDKHASNTAVDLTYARDFPAECLEVIQALDRRGLCKIIALMKSLTGPWQVWVTLAQVLEYDLSRWTEVTIFLFWGSPDTSDVKVAPKPVRVNKYDGNGKHCGDFDDADTPYSPTSPDEFSSTSSASSSDGLSSPGVHNGSEDDAAPRLLRVPHVADRGEHVPDKCSMRLYDGGGKPPYRLGILPPGVVDPAGHHTRRRAFREGLRSEAAAIDQVELWLNVHGETAIDD